MAKRKRNGRVKSTANTNSASTAISPRNGESDISISPYTDLKASAALSESNSNQQSLAKSVINPTSEGALAMQNVESNQNTENKPNSSTEDTKPMDNSATSQNQASQPKAELNQETPASASLDSSDNPKEEGPASTQSAEANTTPTPSGAATTESSPVEVTTKAEDSAKQEASTDSALDTTATSGLATTGISSAAQAVSDVIIASTSGETASFDVTTSLETSLTSAPSITSETASKEASLTESSEAQPTPQDTPVESAPTPPNESSPASSDHGSEGNKGSEDSDNASLASQAAAEVAPHKTIAEIQAEAAEADSNDIYATPEQLAEMAEQEQGIDYSALVAEAQANGASIMEDAVLSNDGHTAIMGLENLQTPTKVKARTHIIIGPNNERIISPMPEEEEVVAPTRPLDEGYLKRLAEINARKASEAERDAKKTEERKKARAKELEELEKANSQPVVNQTSQSLDDFDFGSKRTRTAISVPENNVIKDTPQSSGMGNGIVSNILDNKDPFAGRENQPHDKFGSKVSDFESQGTTQAEIARNRARLALAQDNINQEMEYERIKQRGKERREREQQEAERREQERQRLELERYEQEKERRRQERQAQAQAQTQNADNAALELAQQNMGGDGYVALENDGATNNYNQPYASYADTSDYEGIVAPIAESATSADESENIYAIGHKNTQPEEDSAPTYMVGNINRPQKEIVHTAMFVQGDGEEPSPYVCGVNARRLSDSDLRKFQQQQAQDSDSAFAQHQPRISSLAFSDEENSAQNSYYGQSEQGQEPIQDAQAQGYANFNEDGLAMGNVGAQDFKLQPGFGEDLNFNGEIGEPQAPYAGQFVQDPRTDMSNNAVVGAETENIYWTPGQTTAELQASIANQQRLMQQQQQQQQQMPPEAMPAMPDQMEGEALGEERTEPLPTGMGDGVLALNGGMEQQALTAAAGIDSTTSQQNSGPVYMVGPSRATNQREQIEEEDDGPLYAVGPNKINAQVEAKLQRMNMRNNPTQGMPSPLSQDEFIDNARQAEDEKALAEAARESVAAPQSEVIKRGRQLAAQVSAETMAANAGQGNFNDADLLGDQPEFGQAQGSTFSNFPQIGEGMGNAELNGQEPLQAQSAPQAPFDYEGNQSSFKSALNAEMDLAETSLESNENKVEEVAFTAPSGASPTPHHGQEPVGLGLTSALYLRQLLASFFTHTTLPTFFPHVARKLGPCYPSSMAVPFFFVGLIAALCGRSLAAISPLHDGSGLTFLIYLALTGLAAYRGFYRIGAYFNRHRRDVVLLAASVCVPMTCFVWLTSSLFTSTIGIAEPTLAFAFASMLSAASASTLSWNVQQDPIDSCGSMTTKGVLLVIVFCFMAAFGLLHYIVGFSVLGVTFIMRLAFGFVIAKNHGTAHRSYINALQLLTFFAILIDLTLLKGQGYDLLSTSTLDLVRYIDRLF